MFTTTIGDLKIIARKVWPTALQFNVDLNDPRRGHPGGYFVSAIGNQNLIIGRLAAPTLDDLKLRLQNRLNSGIENSLPVERAPILPVTAAVAAE